MKENTKQFMGPIISNPNVGTALSIFSGISFLFLCMILPLVGPAGAAVPYAEENEKKFLSVLFASLLLSILAIGSKLYRRSIDHSPLPFYSMGVSLMCLLLLVAFLSGLLQI